MVVDSLMSRDKVKWDIVKLMTLFDEAMTHAILNIPLWSSGQEDKWAWVKATYGELTLKSAYKESCNYDLQRQVSPNFGQDLKVTSTRKE
jgi:hypothetical protein